MNIYFSPHPDDAILSCGGRILNEEEPAVVVNLFSGKYRGLTKWDKLCGFGENPMEKRIKEDKEILSSIGVEPVYLDFYDQAVYKDIKNKERSEDGKAKISRKVKKVIDERSPQKVFFPAGINHDDHQLLFKIGERVSGGVEVFFYEDLPHALTRKNNNFEEYRFSRGVMNKKIELILKYKSQIKGFLKISKVKSIEEFRFKMIDYHKKKKCYVERFC